MSSAALEKIPPFAGICSREESERPGLSVAEAARRLRRMARVLHRLALTAAFHLNSTPEWEVKSTLALHAWQDEEHAAMLRARLLEMRESEAALTQLEEQALESWLDELLRAENTVELLAGIYQVARVSLIRSMERYLQQTNPLADHPSCRALKIILMEQRGAAAWGAAALEALSEEEGPEPIRHPWREHLQSYLQAAGGVDGAESRTGTPLPAKRGGGGFHPKLAPKRDSRFRGLYDTSIPADTVYGDESRGIDERNLALLFKRVREMDVPEVIAGILAQSADKSWAFYEDMFRQMWDEARHALLGQAALQARGIRWQELPINVTFSYKLGKYLDAEERHLLLYALEQSLMPARSGKRYEWEIALRSGDALSTTFHDFDWADEVLHAAIGRRHLKDGFQGQPEMLKKGDELVQRIARGLAKEDLPDDRPPQDWWERFAEQALGHPVEPLRKTHLVDWHPVSS